MKTEVLEQKKNPLLNRDEAWISIEHKGQATPSGADVLKDVTAVLKAKEGLVVVDKIFSETGKNTSKVRALVYQKTEDIPKEKLLRMKKRVKKEAPKEEAPTEGEAKPEEKPTEAPAEEKKEEAKPEEKPEEKPAEKAPKEEKPAEEEKKE